MRSSYGRCGYTPGGVGGGEDLRGAGEHVSAFRALGARQRASAVPLSTGEHQLLCVCRSKVRESAHCRQHSLHAAVRLCVCTCVYMRGWVGACARLRACRWGWAAGRLTYKMSISFRVSAQGQVALSNLV